MQMPFSDGCIWLAAGRNFTFQDTTIPQRRANAADLPCIRRRLCTLKGISGAAPTRFVRRIMWVASSFRRCAFTLSTVNEMHALDNMSIDFLAADLNVKCWVPAVPVNTFGQPSIEKYIVHTALMLHRLECDAVETPVFLATNEFCERLGRHIAGVAGPYRT